MKFLSIGSDPEVFIADDDGIVRSVIGKLGGSKRYPRDLGDGYFVQEDNVLAEYNIPPVGSMESFVEAINKGKKLIKDTLPRGFNVVVKTSHLMDESELQ